MASVYITRRDLGVASTPSLPQKKSSNSEGKFYRSIFKATYHFHFLSHIFNQFLYFSESYLWKEDKWVKD